MGVILERVNEAAHGEREALWAASEARDREIKRQELNALRLSYHRGQAERLRLTLEELITHHETQARQLLEKGSA
jgi:uncharacterized protein YnzC (UPF0291/DUF896 family)